MAAESYDAAIIGGGHNGLTCAAYLARAGRRVIVLEAGARLGGAAGTRELAPGFHVPVGAHLIGLLHPRVTADLELERHGLAWAARDLPTTALGEPGAAALTMTGDAVNGAEVSGTDRAAFPAFRERMRRFAGVLAPLLERRPPRLAGGGLADRVALGRLGLRVRRLGREDMRELLRIGAINIHDVLEEHFEDDRLKGALALDAVLGTHMGPRSPNTVLSYLYGLTGPAGGPALPRGGTGGVIEALAGAARASGVTLRTGARVRHLRIEDGAARGVVLEDGGEVAARTVVSSADPKTTFLELVGARHLETGFCRRVHNIRSRGDAAKLHLALDGLPAFRGLDEAATGHRIVLAPSLGYVERAFDPAKYGACSEAPAMEIVIPSVHDAGLAPGGKHVLSAIVQYAPYQLEGGWTQAATDALRRRVIDRLVDFAPDLEQRIEAAELLSPADLERELGTTGGHWHHGELSFDQLLFLRPVPGAAQYATPLEGLYLCGAGAHPGGGVSGLPGRNAARTILGRRG